MNLAMITGGALGIFVSLACCYAFCELSIAYWLPRRSGRRWREFVESPKLAFFAPTFRWLMPLFSVFALVQAAMAVQVVRTGLAAG